MGQARLAFHIPGNQKQRVHGRPRHAHHERRHVLQHICQQYASEHGRRLDCNGSKRRQIPALRFRDFYIPHLREKVCRRRMAGMDDARLELRPVGPGSARNRAPHVCGCRRRGHDEELHYGRIVVRYNHESSTLRSRLVGRCACAVEQASRSHSVQVVGSPSRKLGYGITEPKSPIPSSMSRRLGL